MCISIDVEYIYGFVWWGSAGKVDDVIPSRWRVCVIMATLWQQQDGGYMLLGKRYGNNKMAAMRYYGNVMATTRWRLCVFYIFNSTVIDWTRFFYLIASVYTWPGQTFRINVATGRNQYCTQVGARGNKWS